VSRNLQDIFTNSALERIATADVERGLSRTASTVREVSALEEVRMSLADAAWMLRTAKGKYDHIDFRPPESVAKAAERGLEYRKKGKGGGLSTGEAAAQGIGSGVQRAVNLKNRDTLSPATVKRMHAFFSRHEKNKSIAAEHKGTPWKDRGYVAWLLWGGDPGAAWARKIIRQMDAADEKAKKKASTGYEDGTYMSRRYLRQMAVQAALLSKVVRPGVPLMDWQEAKIAQAGHGLNAVFNALLFSDRSPLAKAASENEPTNPELWSKMKAKAKRTYDKWPSAYAVGWAVKQYNKAGGGWRKKKKKD
jgi:hypothetical protein